MPCDYSRYPPDWKDRRRRVLERADNRCEWCGAENYQPHPKTGSKVILTIAHLDHDPENWNVEDNRLAALCQRCHLGYDSGRIEAPTEEDRPMESIYILIHHTGGDGKSEICGAYTDEEAVRVHCLNDSWGYFRLTVNGEALPPDQVIPMEYVYPTRVPSRWIYDADGWRPV